MSKYGEPWDCMTYSGEYPSIEDNVGAYIASTESEDKGDRIVACVNACAGMEDPVAAIKELTAALEAIVSQHEKRYDPFELHFKWAREVLNMVAKVPS